jgi:hypothetical protein
MVACNGSDLDAGQAAKFISIQEINWPRACISPVLTGAPPRCRFLDQPPAAPHDS